MLFLRRIFLIINTCEWMEWWRPFQPVWAGLWPGSVYQDDHGSSCCRIQPLHWIQPRKTNINIIKNWIWEEIIIIWVSWMVSAAKLEVSNERLRVSTDKFGVSEKSWGFSMKAMSLHWKSEGLQYKTWILQLKSGFLGFPL